MDEENVKKNEKIEIVSGDSKSLDISEVKDNLAFEVHNDDSNKSGNIVVPEEQKKKIKN